MDIFNQPAHYEIASPQGHPRAVTWERVERFTKKALDRVKSRAQETARKDSFLRAEALEKTAVFPGEFVMVKGHYSLSDIKEKASLPEAVFERKVRFRIANMITGASQEVSEDVAAIIRECLAASQKGRALRSVVDTLAREWDLARGDVEQAVLSVLASLAEVGICLTGKNIR